MKTLDEVIKALEECMADDAIESEGVYLATDALHYLKEYREKAHRLDIDIADHRRSFEQLAVEIARYHAIVKDYEELRKKAENIIFEDLRNELLTWDELEEMEDTPVWLEWSSDGSWVQIVDVRDDELRFFRFCDDRIFSFTRDEYEPDKWQAYRKARE